MRYYVGNMVLQTTQELFRGKVNDVVVCQDMTAVSKTYYTMLIIRNHDTTKRILELYEAGGEAARRSYIAGFTWQDSYLMLFDYQAEHPIDEFFSAVVESLPECERLCLHIVMECMASGIPWPILYLQLEQNQINIWKDESVCLGYRLDLSGLSGLKTEKDCVTLCAQKLFFLLEQMGTAKTVSYRLLELKNQREGYSRFLDLYQDIQATAVSEKKDGFFARLKGWFRRWQDRIFRVLLIGCLSMAAVALVMLVSQMIFADIPLIRLFVNTFRQIGTESLLK